MLTVSMIGTAATMPLPGRATAAAAMGCCGRWVLLDCGEGTQVAARQAKVNLMKVDAICLTHYHGDHIFGLPGLLQTLGTMERREPLTIIGPEGLQEAMQPILTLVGGELTYPVRLMTLPTEGIALNQLHRAWPALARLTAFPTRHRVISQGYMLTLGRAGKFQADKARTLGVPQNLWRELQLGKSVCVDGRMISQQDVVGTPRRGLKAVYSGDTMPCDELRQAAQDADLLICEATYPTEEYADKAAQFGHSTYADAGKLAREAGVRRLWLTHYSAMISDPEAYLSAAQEAYPEARCGDDGMTETLQFSP